MTTQMQAKADELIAEWIRYWLQAREDGYQLGPFDEFIVDAIENVERGLGPDDAAEESQERQRDRYYGDAPAPRWGKPEDDRADRAWDYDLSTPEEVISLLAERGHTI